MQDQRNSELHPLSASSDSSHSDSDDIDHPTLNPEEDPTYDESSYVCSCNANIYNAFLIANHRKDLDFKTHSFVESDKKFGLGFLAYITAIIQWIALFTMIAAFIDKSSAHSPWVINEHTLGVWTWAPSGGGDWLTWPFFLIGLLSTYKQLAQIFVDIRVLEEWNIDYKLFHVIVLKYCSELVLYTGGSFAFYLTLSWYSTEMVMLDVILKLLAYQYIFLADECAYLLVKDIVTRRLTPHCCHLFFQGTRKGKATRYEMMTAITIPMSISFIVQGVYARTVSVILVGIFSTFLWTFDMWATKCLRKKN